MSSRPGTRSRRELGGPGWSLLVLVLLSCNERFEFDLPGRGGAGGGGSGSGGGGTTGGAASGTAGATAGGQTAAGAAGAGSAGVAGASTQGPCGKLAECPSGLHCADDECLQCATHTDCSGLAQSRCAPEQHRCVECVVGGDCPTGFVCDALSSRCFQSCQEDAECPEGAHGCDGQRAVCFNCDEDRECEASPLGPRCAADGSGCVECRGDADCEGLHCDVLTGRCVACRDTRDCGAGVCNPTTGVCLAP